MKCWWVLGALLVMLLPASGHALETAELPALWQPILAEAANIKDPGARAVHLSTHFLGTPYRAQTLVGSAASPEQLTIRLGAVDCFTFIDYVEALRRSATPAQFRDRLIEVRYRNRLIAWETRRHFFTDWGHPPEGLVADVTAEVGGKRARTADKQLNRKADDTLYLPGVAVQVRTVHFIPTSALEDRLLAGLRSGDYLGIYSAAPGLDVSHVGIVVRSGGRLLLRHASSSRSEQRVIDSDLTAYLAGKPGIVVLRPQAVAEP